MNQPSHLQRRKIFKSHPAHDYNYHWNLNPNPNLDLYFNPIPNLNLNLRQRRTIGTPPLLPSARTLQPLYTSNNMLLLKTAIKNSMLKNGTIDEFTVKNNFLILRKPRSRSSSRPNVSREIKPSRLSTMSKAEDFI
ncbi:hypothetical protein S245_020919 [Arachis hypogaea]|nr:uncharacterized protein DS421_6g193060 [Arachis hypogaea]